MSDAASPWPIGSELWHYAVVGERYEPRLLGRVRFVGVAGVTVALATPDQFGATELRVLFGCPGIWTTEAETREWCEARGGPWAHLRRE